MRAAVLGVALAADRETLLTLVDRSSRITHRDPRAIDGGRVIAIAASRAHEIADGSLSARGLLGDLKSVVITEDWLGRLDLLDRALNEDWTSDRLTTELGCAKGVSGYVLHSAPVALWCWLRASSDFRLAIETAVGLGGDTDTIAATVGGLSGAGLGEEAIPQTWVAGVKEWPRTTLWLHGLARSVERNEPLPRLASYGIPLRNLFFLMVVLGHGFTRLAK